MSKYAPESNPEGWDNLLEWLKENNEAAEGKFYSCFYLKGIRNHMYYNKVNGAQPRRYCHTATIARLVRRGDVVYHNGDVVGGSYYILVN